MAQDPRQQLGQQIPFPEVDQMMIPEGASQLEGMMIQPQEPPQPMPEQVLQAITAKMLETLGSEDLAKDVQAQTVNVLAQAFKTMIETLTNDPQQALQMEQQKMDMQFQMEQAKMQMEMEKHQMELQMKQEEHQLKLQQSQAENSLKLEQARQKAQFDQVSQVQKLQHQQVEGEQKLRMNEEAMKQKKAQQDDMQKQQAKAKTKP